MVNIERDDALVYRISASSGCFPLGYHEAATLGDQHLACAVVAAGVANRGRRLIDMSTGRAIRTMTRLTRMLVAVVQVMVAAWCLPVEAARLALVIGNDQYRHIKPLVGFPSSCHF